MINLGDLMTLSISSFLSFNLFVNSWIGAIAPPPPKTADYFVVDSITARRAADTAILVVDREILAPIEMSFAVRVMAKTEAGWAEVCSMGSPVIEYQPGTVLPDPVTLDWWTWGECPVLPPGDAQIRTTWTPANGDLAPVSVTVEIVGRT